MRAAPADLAALRRQLAAKAGFTPGVPTFTLGAPGLDAALPVGLARGALHEVFAGMAPDATAAAGFATALSLRAAGKRKILWVRQRYAEMETGGLYAPGLAEFGLDPSRLILVDVRDPADVLRAGEEAVRCSVLGATLIELWKEPKALDLTASRRLALAAENSGVTLVMLRAGASPAPSAATTRWSVSPALSAPFEANAPGRPAFSVTLQRHRGQAAGRSWRVEWNRDRQSFDDIAIASGASHASLPGGLASLPAGRPDPAPGGLERLAR